MVLAKVVKMVIVIKYGSGIVDFITKYVVACKLLANFK